MAKAAAAIAPGRQSLIPAGVVLAYIGTVAPAGWLLCFGQTLNKADYPALAALCAAKFGADPSSSTFLAPDLRGRVIAGQDDMGGTSADRITGFDGDVIGTAGGSETGGATLRADLTGGGSEGAVQSFGAEGVLPPTIILNYIIKT